MIVFLGVECFNGRTFQFQCGRGTGPIILGHVTSCMWQVLLLHQSFCSQNQITWHGCIIRIDLMHRIEDQKPPTHTMKAGHTKFSCYPRLPGNRDSYRIF